MEVSSITYLNEWINILNDKKTEAFKYLTVIVLYMYRSALNMVRIISIERNISDKK